MGPSPRPGILDISPYVGGSHAVEGVERAIVLSANEGALGPSPKALAAFRRAAARVPRYPEGGAPALRQAIARHHGVDPAQIVCGNGSDELIGLLVQAYAAPGDEVLFSQHGFLMYRLAAMAYGATPVAAPETDLKADVDALLDHVSGRTRLVFLANPNNPTGSFLPVDEVERLRRQLTEQVLLVIDAAYAEYVVRNDYTSGAELVEAAGNVVMTRTFSKIYGLAGLRLGWAYCPLEVADALHRVRTPFNVSVAAEAAGRAALDDTRHTDAGRSHNEVWRPWLADRLAALGLTVYPSIANFVLVRFPPEPGRDAEAANGALERRGIIARRMGAYGLADCLRISIGLEPEVRAVVDALTEFVG
ncbi:MAG: histidinol-phosphate transaminase [Kiloniellales bacterium]